MTIHSKGPAPGGRADSLELSTFCGVDLLQANIPNEAPAQAENRIQAEFDAEIALALIASGWRATAYLLINAALLIETGDFQSAERNRRQARGQFVEANDLFKLFQEMRAAEAASRFAAEAFS